MPLRAIKTRRTIRRYTDDTVPEDRIKDLLSAAMFAPSAWGKRSWEFIVVDDADIKKELGTLTPYATHAATASHVIIVMSDMALSSSWIEDSAIAAEHINLEAAKNGLGSSWIQVRHMHHNERDAEAHLRSLLSIPDHYGICCMVTIGYAAEEKSPHSESEFEEDKVHLNKFGLKAA